MNQKTVRSRAPARNRNTLTAGTVVKRILLVLVTVLLLAVISLFVLCSTIAHGPSETVRDALVLSAMQASATKWVPGLFLDKDTVNGIMEASEKQNNIPIIVDPGYVHTVTETDAEGKVIIVPVEETEEGPAEESEDWDKAIDGMLYFTLTGPTYKAYVLLIKDPARVYLGTSSDYHSGKTGIRIFDIVERENAVAAINGGEFYDNGSSTGDNPLGLTYSLGKCVWEDGHQTNFFGIDENDRLVVRETMTKKQAEELHIRDGCSFQHGNVLITHEGSKVNYHYAPGNSGLAQRTAIGQRADGTIIFVVTDGRTASSLGCNHDGMINLMASLGAVEAGMLDGGSSTMMYYRDYYTKYGIDTKYLDSYQKKGLVNKYKAFSNPRRIPTYFLVSPEGGEG